VPEPLSICIVSWNSEKDLPACLAALLDSMPQPPGPVVLVDNASRDDSVGTARRILPAIRVVAQERNLGLGAACNRAARESNAEVLVFLNPDVTLAPGALQVLQQFFLKHPDAGVCGPKLLNPDGSLQPSCRSFPTLLTGFFRYTFLGRLFPHNRFTRAYLMQDFDHASVREVDWLSGACLAVRAQAFWQIGGFDEAYFMFCEDTDLCYRMKQAGWKCYYVPEACAYHKIGGSTNQAVARMIVAWHKSMYRFYCKHYRHQFSWAARALAVAGIGLRCLGALTKTAYYAFLGRLSRLAKGSRPRQAG